MIAFPQMLVSAAEQACITVPENVDDFDKEKFPHWTVFCNMQLGRRMPYPGCHWENAKLIAQIPVDKIMQITPAEILAIGYL